MFRQIPLIFLCGWKPEVRCMAGVTTTLRAFRHVTA